MHFLDTSPAETGLQPGRPDRRRRIRHKVHTPAYACVNPNVEQPLDLCEIVDISERGMAIQTFTPMEVGRDERFSLDLAETGAFIQTAGRVVWSKASGHTGIEFPEIAGESRSAFCEWLFGNAIANCSDQASEPGSRTTAEDNASANIGTHSEVEPADYEARLCTDYTAVLSGVGAVKREAESLGADLDAVLQLVARRSLNFTRASGAAIALMEGQDMLCLASAGSDAPPVGTRLQAGVGFSGECVRTGMLLRCDDSEVDPRVDRESSRSLGIRSMIATPLLWEGSVLGLLEVFSPEVANFGANDEVVLQRLAGIISTALDRARSPQAARAEKPLAPVDDEFPVETPADLPLALPQLSRSRNMVLIAAALTVVFVIVWLIASWNGNRLNGSPLHSSQLQVPADQSSPAQQGLASPLPTTAGEEDKSIDALRRLADQGDSVAQFSVGVRYATGQGVPADYTEAARWFTRAAELGSVAAQATLGNYYWAGRGVAPDPIKAYFWSLVAEADGDTSSKDRAAEVSSHLTRGQVLAVQQQAQQWVRQHPAARQAASIQ